MKYQAGFFCVARYEFMHLSAKMPKRTADADGRWQTAENNNK